MPISSPSVETTVAIDKDATSPVTSTPTTTSMSQMTIVGGGIAAKGTKTTSTVTVMYGNVGDSGSFILSGSHERPPTDDEWMISGTESPGK